MAAKVPKGFRPYDLRHTMASLLLQAGVSVKVVSARLGHNDIMTTLRYYAHIIPGMQEAAEKMEVILGEERKEAANRCSKCSQPIGPRLAHGTNWPRGEHAASSS